MKTITKTHILIVEDNPSDKLLIEAAFSGIHEFDYELKYAESLQEGLYTINSVQVDVVLLDLGLPDSYGIDTFLSFHQQVPELPVLVLTALEDITVGLQALSEGAQDYLIKKNIHPVELGHAIRYAIERQQLHLQLQKSRDQLRQLAIYLQTVREKERTRISREIHDELGQKMSALKMDLRWLGSHLVPQSDKAEAVAKRLRDAELLVNKSIESVQRIAIELRPSVLDHLGVVDAIRDESRRFHANTGINIDLKLPKSFQLADQDISTTLFRIFQELLTNITRHAHAQSVAVKFGLLDKQLVLEVADDGVGMPANLNGPYVTLGLLGMHERVMAHGGEISIESAAGKGTHVVVNIPFK